MTDELTDAKLDALLERLDRYHFSKDGKELCEDAIAAIRSLRQRGRASKNVLREVSSEWHTDINDNAVTCHSRMIEGVLCRWWGDGPTPKGVAMIDAAQAAPDDVLTDEKRAWYLRESQKIIDSIDAPREVAPEPDAIAQFVASQKPLPPEFAAALGPDLYVKDAAPADTTPRAMVWMVCPMCATEYADLALSQANRGIQSLATENAELRAKVAQRVAQVEGQVRWHAEWVREHQAEVDGAHRQLADCKRDALEEAAKIADEYRTTNSGLLIAKAIRAAIAASAKEPK